ncbi:MAG: XRE family transcriptional regulator [Bacteroidota bacterium]|nr:XRE family transcriptional regulator [Bacteroidota bacterium]
MKRDSLSAVGKTIKRIRKENKMSLKDVAEKSNVTAGLLSKIENFRAIPSLPVLQSISLALDVNLVDLVREVNTNEGTPYILIRKGEGEMEEREDSIGVSYELLITDSISNSYLRTVVVTVNPGVYREQVVTDCWEIDYILSGEITYKISEETVVLKEGDIIYYDGNFPHSMENNSTESAKMITFYFMKPNV